VHKPVDRASSAEAAFFDLDKTIITKSSALAFGRPFYAEGLINRRSMLRSAYAQLVFRMGGADHEQMERLRKYLSEMCAGWSVDQVREIVHDTLHEAIHPYIYDEAARLIDLHHDENRDVVIVSSSGSEIVEPIADMLGADHVIATRMVVRDGAYTGVIDFYPYRETKANAMRELADQLGYDLSQSYAYSDSITDLPMLEAVGRPHAVNPDRALRREAIARDWPILAFDHPISLRDRMRDLRLSSKLPSKPVAVIATAAGAAAAGIAWYYVGRRRLR
jgi:HAD superfamily hydrolase (TIGR01490 family)